jgi:signal transduction histidine kinase
MPLGELDAYITHLRWLLLGAIWAVVLIGMGVSTLLTNYFSRHFSRAQELAATVSEGNYHLRIPEDGPRELRDLSHYLNIMAEKLQEQLKTRRVLLANVTHELARPLAGLQLGIESLRKGAIQDSNLADDLLVSMEHSINRLKSRIEDLALAAQAANRPIELYLTEVALEPFLKGTAAFFWSLATAHGARLEVQVQPDLPLIWVDEKRLHQIVGNLVDNAIKFTAPGGIIKLSAERAGECHVCITVHDGGPGMPPEEIEQVFRPFYQGEGGQRLRQGMGLGLSIAQQLAQAHNGSLTLKNHPDGGVIATLTLPIAPA